MRTTTHDHEWNPKYFGIISALFCGVCMITASIVSKLVDINGIVLSAGLITFPLCCILADMLTEIYGFNRTRQVIWATLICSILFALFTQIAIIMQPASFWPNQDGFAATFATTWRIALAGCAAWIVGELVNSFIMARMKVLQNGQNMSFRFIGSTVVGQFFDTLVFSTIAFIGVMPFSQLLQMMLIAWVAKVLYEVFALPLSISATNWVKKLEGVEHFDKQKLRFI